MKYGPVVYPLTEWEPSTVPENQLVTSHSVTFSFSAGTNYQIKLINNEIEGAPFYWPNKWPLDSDANLDCRVNILDLIFIRSRLAAPAGDNWQANVNNEDDYINMKDLIHTRNHLNTQCPSP